jgi:hypothetical protein
VESPDLSCNLTISNDDGEQRWKRWEASKGGLQLGATKGPWEWSTYHKALYLKDDDRMTPYFIVFEGVPADFLLVVVCGKSLSGEASESSTKFSEFLYTLWDGCV